MVNGLLLREIFLCLLCTGTSQYNLLKGRLLDGGEVPENCVNPVDQAHIKKP